MNILMCVCAPVSDSGDHVSRPGALNGAMQASEKIPGVRITAAAVEEPGGIETLRTCLALAADKAVLIRNPGISRYDPAAFGALMAGAVASIEETDGTFDAIFCGDNDQGQEGLGPALAGYLGRPQITGASSIERDAHSLLVRQNWDGACTLLQVNTPCVISFLPSHAPVGYPKLPRLMAANRAEVPVYGVQTSPRVQQLLSFHPRPGNERIFKGSEAGLFVKCLLDEPLLRDAYTL